MIHIFLNIIFIIVILYLIYENATLQEECQSFKNLTFVDTLTGLPNRRKFDKELESIYGHWIRFNRPFCVVMLDIDKFKVVNDTYGHAVGDIVLKSLSRNLTPQLRKYDMLARWGGEEFIMLLPEVDEITATNICERMRASIEQTPIINNGIEYRITVSFGVAEIKTDYTCISQLIDQADKALYFSKNNGRNKVSNSSMLVNP